MSNYNNRISLLINDRIRLLRRYHYNAYFSIYLKSEKPAHKALDDAKAPRYLDEVRKYITNRKEFNALKESV